MTAGRYVLEYLRLMAGCAVGFVQDDIMTRTLWRMQTTLALVALMSLPGALLIAGARDSRLRQLPKASVQELEPQRTVWDGVYTETQAQRGAPAYQQLCSRCHRENLEGEAGAPPLTGAAFFDRWSYLSVQDLFFAIQITMSHSAELFEPSQKVADVVSFVFRANKMPSGTAELPIDAVRLRQILITGKPATQSRPNVQLVRPH
jgi:hypothetical protein